MRRVATAAGLVPAAPGDAGDGFDAEIAVMQCEISSECRRRALDVDAIVAELRAMLSSPGERLVGDGVLRDPVAVGSTDDDPRVTVPDTEFRLIRLSWEANSAIPTNSLRGAKRSRTRVYAPPEPRRRPRTPGPNCP